MIIGIYKITNKINNKSYIGQSIDIDNRIKTHFKNCFNEKNKEYEKSLYRAIRDKLNEREIYYINYFNSYQKGYNETPGGDGVKNNKGDNHPNHKLTEEDIIDIRNRYNNRERCEDVYQLYEDKIKRTGFNKIWKGETWKTVKMEVYTDENKYFHKHNTGNVGTKNGRSRLTEEDVYNIRLKRKEGLKMKDVYQQYNDKVTLGSFKNVWYGYNWKNIIV